MSKIVEIIAPSGTGKSTLYKSLQKRWAPHMDWAVYHDMRYRRKPGLKNPDELWRAIQRRLNPKPEADLAYRYSNLNEARKPYEKLFYRAYPEFCNLAMGLLSKHGKKGFDGKDRRYMNTFFFFETVEHLMAIMDRKADPRACVMDEGLLSRLMHLNAPTFTDEDMLSYIQHMPLPSAAIYLKCDPKVIANRIGRRKKRSTVHRNLSEEMVLNSTRDTQQLMEKMLNAVEAKGVNVFSVDASVEPESLSGNVFELLQSGID